MIVESCDHIVVKRTEYRQFLCSKEFGATTEFIDTRWPSKEWSEGMLKQYSMNTTTGTWDQAAGWSPVLGRSQWKRCE